MMKPEYGKTYSDQEKSPVSMTGLFGGELGI